MSPYFACCLQLSKGECEDTPRVELPAFLEQAPSLDHLDYNFDLYLLYLDEEEDDIIHWYFDARSKFDDTTDYQRLVLKNYIPTVSASNDTHTKLLAVQRLPIFISY